MRLPLLASLFLSGVLLGSGCGLKAGWVPRAHQATPESVAASPFGARVALYGVGDWTRILVTGELIATTSLTVIVLGDDGTISEIAWAGLSRVRVYRGSTTDIAAGAAVSTATSLGATAPVAWLAAWGAGVGRRRPVRDLGELDRYARFPQGLPEGIDLDTLQPQHPTRGGGS